MTLRLKLLLIVILATAISACSQGQKKSSTKNTNDRSTTLEYSRSVSFMTFEGDTISTVDVTVADDESERNQGLMDVRDLPESKGMLFIFDENQPRSFWMANTPLPLDIIFVNSDGEIVRIHHNTQPFSEENYTSGEPAKYVIEVNAGYCVSHDIQEGMRVSL